MAYWGSYYFYSKQLSKDDRDTISRVPTVGNPNDSTPQRVLIGSADHGDSYSITCKALQATYDQMESDAKNHVKRTLDLGIGYTMSAYISMISANMAVGDDDYWNFNVRFLEADS